MASETATPPTSQTPVPASVPASANGEQGTTAPVTKSTTTTTTSSKPTTDKKESGNNSSGIAASVVQAAKKYIPGLGAQSDKATASATGGSKRSKGSKKSGVSSSSSKIANANDPALQTALTAEAPEKSELPKELVDDGNGLTTKPHPTLVSSSTNGNNAIDAMSPEELAVLEQKRFSPVLIIQKRLRAHNKKLQRIAAYENETNLNADQKKALATKPALELVQKELSDIIKVFEAEEAEDEKHTARKKQYEEKQTQIRINQALSQSSVSSQTDLTLLLQFLHLYSLFNPAQSFAPPTDLPAVVANATGQQSAAVHTLFDKLANGPLFGGAATSSSVAAGDDAVSHIKALQEGASTEIIEGVTFADVKQMIIDLTAPPAEIGHELPERSNATVGGDLPAVDESAQQHDLTNANTAGAAAPGGFSFMQASELDRPATETTATAPLSAHDRALESVSAAATPGFGSGTPVLEKSVEQANTPVGWESAAAPAEDATQPAASAWAEDTSNPIKNWADDVEDSGVPSNPYITAPDVPSELAETNGVPVINSDARTAGPRGRGRGGRGGRGGEPRRGRGGNAGEGGNRRSDNFHWRRTDPVNESAANAAIAAGEGNDGFIEAGADRRGGSGGHRGSGRGRGEYRGGRGGNRGGERGAYRGGEYRGRGRGGPRGQSNAPAGATATQAPASTEV